MKTAINLTATSQDLNRFADCDDLKHFYHDKGIDGIELMLCGAEQLPEKITPEDINGIHMSYFPSWLDFWNQDQQALDKEYGNRNVWSEYYHGTEPHDLLKVWEKELETAHRLGVSYVVFHVSECTLDECITYHQKHSDEEVCKKACEIINILLDGKPYQFHFLMENLWWSGLTLTRPEITRQLLEGVHYPHKGIMLDTGHLLHTNWELGTQKEAVAYIHKILDQNGELCSFIRGIHLNQSLSGTYVKQTMKNPPKLIGTYWERMRQIYPHVFQIDCHKPFTAPGVTELIERISPEFLTYELISSSREDHEKVLNKQLQIWNKNGGI